MSLRAPTEVMPRALFEGARSGRFYSYTLNWLPALIASQNTATQCKGAPTISGGL
jgi:hypothetical protein